jgi:hypothetical protein
VVLTSHGRGPLRAHCQALGAERFFDKATEFNELIAYLEAACAAGAD